jgi:hypothetical protein
MKLLAWMFAALLALAGPAVAQERIAAAAGGISIEKPVGWTVMPPDRVLENVRGLTYESPEFRRVVDATGAPFITMIKYPADREGINPTMKVNYQRLPASMHSMGPVEVLTGVVGAMRSGFGEVDILVAPHAVQFAGAPGAHVRIAYTIKGAAGTPFETVSEMWIILRGGYAIILGVGYGRDEPAATVSEIQGAALSFRID